MQAFPEFKDMNPAFWSLVKYISETLGYTDRKTKSIRTYTSDDITNLFIERNINTPEQTISRLKSYFDKRADILNNTVKNQLMDADTAKIEFEQLQRLHAYNNYLCKLPMNKQKGNMARVNYLIRLCYLSGTQFRKGSFIMYN